MASPRFEFIGGSFVYTSWFWHEKVCETAWLPVQQHSINCIHDHGETKAWSFINFDLPGAGGASACGVGLIQNTQIFSRGNSGLREMEHMDGLGTNFNLALCLRAHVRELFSLRGKLSIN